jgi:menaquinol-cytochrome c reductase iron-sulfur subunit
MTKGYKHRVSRRDFVKLVTTSIGGIISAMVGLPIIGYLLSPAMRNDEVSDVIALGPLENYPIGIPTPFSFIQKRINGWENTTTVIGMYVVRKDDGAVRVFSDICTHLGCLVTWKPDIEEYLSPCHDGHFDIEGLVTHGPPPRPLDEFQTNVENGKLYIMYPPYLRAT